jgi:hypothetical protein|nr:MAG TPA: SH3 domain protein [Caudoviricetes sp.]
MMKATELVNKAIDIAKNYKTLYVMGCFGAPMTAANKARYTTNHSYNKAAARVKMINAATEDTFGFDCVCLIKAILWGWDGDKNATYGGAKYASNNVPDIGADTMIKRCTDASTTGWADMEPGEVVWTTGHIGIYIGDGLAVECTPKWKNCVQITAVGNIGTKSGYNARTWKKHGHLPYVEYEKSSTGSSGSSTTATTTTSSKEVKASGVAKSFDKSIAGTYTVTASSGLNVRDAAGTGNKVLVSIPKGTSVKNYGYYTEVGGVKWLYVQFTYKGITYTGFCSAAYLKK